MLNRTKNAYRPAYLGINPNKLREHQMRKQNLTPIVITWSLKAKKKRNNS